MSESSYVLFAAYLDLLSLLGIAASVCLNFLKLLFFSGVTRLLSSGQNCCVVVLAHCLALMGSESLSILNSALLMVKP